VSDCNDRDGNCTVLRDPDDGGVVQCVGPWATDKHDYVRRYFEATRNVRGMYDRAERGHNGGTGYIDLFAGPGRFCIRGRLPVMDGTPLIAVNMRMHPFTDIILCDLADANVAALRMRTANDPRVHVEPGDCNKTIDRVVARIPRYGYNVAVVDPYGPSDLAFETVERLAAFDRMDLIIHFPTNAIRRNFDRPAGRERFVGRSVEMVHGSDVAEVMALYRSRLAKLGYGVNTRAPRIANTRNGTLYHLMFASKHERGDAIWDSITRTEPSGQLGLGLAL
jgi:three-Cys-motif partner protein